MTNKPMGLSLLLLVALASTHASNGSTSMTTLAPYLLLHDTVPQKIALRTTAAANPKLEVDGKIKATQGAADDAALELTGAIKVSGSDKAAFQVTVNTANSTNYFQVNSNGTLIDYYRITTPMTINDPNALIVATPVSTVLSYPFWVGYDANNTVGGGSGQWYIAEPRYNGIGGFTNGMRFNVMIIKQ